MLPLTVVAQKISLGTCETHDNGIYQGEMLGGKPHGKGKTTFSNGDTYEGSFKDNHFSKGTYTVKATGEQFTGTFDSYGQPKKGSWYDKNGNFLQSV